MQSGLLQVCILKPFLWIIGPVLTYRLFAKNIHHSKYMEIIAGKNIEIHRSDGKPLCIHYDGEAVPSSISIKIEVKPLTLKVIFPEGKKI